MILKNIYVGNLPFSTTEQELQQLFEAHGAVSRVNVVMDRDLKPYLVDFGIARPVAGKLKENFEGTVKSMPAREDITMPIQEQLIVELYSK